MACHGEGVGNGARYMPRRRPGRIGIRVWQACVQVLFGTHARHRQGGWLPQLVQAGRCTQTCRRHCIRLKVCGHMSCHIKGKVCQATHIHTNMLAIIYIQPGMGREGRHGYCHDRLNRPVPSRPTRPTQTMPIPPLPLLFCRH